MSRQDTLRPKLRAGRQADEQGPQPSHVRRALRTAQHFDRGKRGWRGVYVHAPAAGTASQRVIVKTVVVKPGTRGLRSFSAGTRLHQRYMERDSVNPQTGEHEVYAGLAHEEAQSGFAARAAGDPHQFRIVLSPEHGSELNLTTFTRQFMAQMEQDVGGRLDWVAANHYDTTHPHTHVLLRGRDVDGQELGLKPYYLERGMTYRAQDIATETLGPRQEREHSQEQGLGHEQAREIARVPQQEHDHDRSL